MSGFDSIFRDGEIVFSANQNSAVSEWTLSCTGDFAPLPLLQKTIEQGRFDELMENIATLAEADVSITNLEVALCSDSEIDVSGVRGSRALFWKMHERFPFSVYSLANNHIMDAGPAPLIETINEFKERGVHYVGAGLTSEDAGEPALFAVKNVNIGVLAFAQRENQIATENSPGALELTQDEVLSRSAELVRSVDVPIVILHEGFEFMNVPRLFLRDLCRFLVDSGVKVVFAHHPHVPQGMERIGDSIVFHGLGNFLFSQPHFAPYPWTRRSFVPSLTFEGEKLARVELKTFEIEGDSALFIRPAEGARKREILERLEKSSAIIKDDDLMSAETKRFFTSVLLPEFFGFIQRHGNDNDGDFSTLIKKFETNIPVRNLFADYAAILAGERD